MNSKEKECSCCNKSHVTVKTEIITPFPDKPNGIKKAIFLLCEDHMDCTADEMEYLSLLKSMNVKQEDLAFDICDSEHDIAGSACKGVRVTYKPSGTSVSNTNEEYQFFNKIRAIQKLKQVLNS